MLSYETENKIARLLLGIASGDKNIDGIKHSFLEKSNIDPVQLFCILDKEMKSTITIDNLNEFVIRYNINTNLHYLKAIILFYDNNGDGVLDFKEFINLIISDSDFFFKKSLKQMFRKGFDTPSNISHSNSSEIGLSAFAKILENEIDFVNYISELINELKSLNDFNLQDMFYSIKSYSYITEGSIKAFFDKNGINYTTGDIKSIFNRIDFNKDGKISFNDLKILFSLNTLDNHNNNLLRNFSNSDRNNNNTYQLQNSDRNYHCNNEMIFQEHTQHNYDIPHYQNKFTYVNNSDDEYQYECIHLSRSGSPIHKSNIKNKSRPLSPVINPPISDGGNNPYRIYHREHRENTLSKSKSRSLSRNSDYQSPGNKSLIKNSSEYKYTPNLHTYNYKDLNMNCNVHLCSRKNLQLSPRSYKKPYVKSGEVKCANRINENINYNNNNYLNRNYFYAQKDTNNQQKEDIYSHYMKNSNYIRDSNNTNNTSNYNFQAKQTYEVDKSF